MLLLCLLLWFQAQRDDPGARLHEWEERAEQMKAQQVLDKIHEREAAYAHAHECYQKAIAARDAFTGVASRGPGYLDLKARKDAVSAVHDWAKCEGLKL